MRLSDNIHRLFSSNFLKVQKRTSRIASDSAKDGGINVFEVRGLFSGELEQMTFFLNNIFLI